MTNRDFDGSSGIANPEPENPFRFTPIKALRALPRLWERKPTTPYRAGAKSRKLWKRFQSSFSGMKTLEQSDMFETDALQTAINTSKDAGYVRGVKRLCVGSEQTEGRVDTEQPGRSFLETKWESGASRKRRECGLRTVPEFGSALTKVYVVQGNCRIRLLRFTTRICKTLTWSLRVSLTHRPMSLMSPRAIWP